MKKIFVIILVVSVACVSCKKECFQCDNGIGGQSNRQMEVCPDDIQYEYIEDGVVYTDELGNPYHCVR